MRLAPRSIRLALARIDPDLSVQWNRGRSRWEVFARRKLLRPAQRKRFVPVCSFRWAGRPCLILEPKPIDRWHIMFWEGPRGEYRDLDMNLVDEVHRRDMWRERLKDIVDGHDRLARQNEERREKKRRQDFRDATLEVDGPLRRDICADGPCPTDWVRHHPANWTADAPWKRETA